MSTYEVYLEPENPTMESGGVIRVNVYVWERLLEGIKETAKQNRKLTAAAVVASAGVGAIFGVGGMIVANGWDPTVTNRILHRKFGKAIEERFSGHTVEWNSDSRNTGGKTIPK